ncbi:ferredoxin-NADP reductase [Frondihabitans sp. PhB188]|uniref:FAD-dependent oxidoreductase n=1 Tax=Frondihabitans sp. PhB188 TaxID=2485200 RepID=UPI000F4AD54F|nr:oxidoreductase [Frondihabitans sp. PhB188]ROQ39768.1 ferredoxin-NADP reductase [Frondihabitans sp. PhB188]
MSAPAAALGRTTRPRSVSAWFDGVTGRVTMYRLVLLALLALLVWSLIAAALGLIAYSPLAIVVGALVACVATVVSTRLLALAFRAKAHTESSFVTALILVFLFQPSLTGTGIAALAIAGAVASASKYLLAIRGRHVANPAAIAAVVMSVAIPAAFPGWWIGSPAMLPVVLVASLAILRRTRKLTMGLVFAVVAIAGVTLASMSFGTALPAALSNAVLSSPVVFFAGFMLSEPLTLPPRRWQQLALAVIVGVLFALPFHVGPLYGTYELALVIGNVLAFAVGQRRRVALEFVERRRLTPTAWEVAFRPRRPVAFRAGQFLELSIPHAGADVRGQRRVFSIVSAPSEPDVIRIGIKAADPSSTFKSRLLALGDGETVSATVVGGDFTLPADASVPLLLVAGGIGVTPFVSQLAEAAARDELRDVVVVLSASTPDELAYLGELRLGAGRGIVLTQELPAHLPPGWTYAGRGPLTVEHLRDLVPDAHRRRAYVSGSPRLVAGVKAVMKRAGVHRTTTDAFTGY